MTKRIFKYPFDANPTMTLKYTRVVMVGQDHGDLAPTVWVEHGDGEQEHHLSMHGTGHEIPDHADHVGSCQCPPFVWHIYESNFK